MKQPWRSYYNAICRDWVAKHNRTTRNGVGNCGSKTGSRRQSEKKTILKHFLKGFLEGQSLAPKWRKKRISCETSSKTPSATPPPAPLAMPFTLREASYSCKSQWNSIDNSSSSTTCNPIYIAGTILQLQITMEFCRPHIHEKQLKPHLQCGTDPSMIRAYPRMIRPHTRPSRNRRTAEVDHRGSGTDFAWKNIGFRSSAISQKHISCDTSSKTPSATPPPAPLAMPFTLREASYSCKSQWNFIDNSSSSTTCNPIYIAGTILQLQITMEFCRPHIHEKQLKPHLQCGTDPSMIRAWSEHDPNISEDDPTTHETVSHPSHRRGRSSRFGDGLCMENIRFRASAISQKRISCETSSKTPSATPPPAPLAMPFTLREASYSCKSQWNSIDNSSSSTTCNPIYIAGTILQLQITMEFCRPHIHEKQLKPHLQCGTDPSMIRAWSEHDPNISEDDPTTHETVLHPSHRRGRSSRFGDGLCMENIRFRASAISQKRISCETSSKTPSATPPPAPLAMPFTVRERS